MSEYTIDISDQELSPHVEHPFLADVIRRVLAEEKVDSATISVALVSDDEIHKINRQYLGHDYPTDVISFLLNKSSEEGVKINGELIVSTETAVREAIVHGWSPREELLLYVVHGLLHLCGYDDVTDAERPRMRSREKDLLAIWGFCPTGLEP